MLKALAIPLPLLAALSCACVDLPAGTEPATAAPTAIQRAPFAELDPGAYVQTSLHFKVSAYGAENARRISDAAESFYQNIMVDTNLFSFMPSGLYEIVVYADHREYVAKTKQPEWSGGVAYGNAIYSFIGPHLGETLAHEMTHLVFNEFMARPRPDLLWLNEGLAVYEQGKAGSGKAIPADLFAGVRGRVRAFTMPEMLEFVPLSQKSDQDSAMKVSIWYAQAESMVQYILDRGGRIGFSQFLNQLKSGSGVGAGLDAAIGSSYPGIWNDSAGLYQAWNGAP